MPLQLNRRPVGVDDVLGGKAWPTVQTQVADQVVVTYDATRDYLASRRYGATGNVVASAGTANTQSANLFNVPAGEAWYIENIGVVSSTALPAGFNVTSVILSVTEIGWGNLALFTGPPFRQWSFTTNYSAGHNLREGCNAGCWVYPATQIAVTVNGSGLVAQQFQGTWSGTRILL